MTLYKLTYMCSIKQNYSLSMYIIYVHHTLRLAVYTDYHPGCLLFGGCTVLYLCIHAWIHAKYILNIVDFSEIISSPFRSIEQLSNPYFSNMQWCKSLKILHASNCIAEIRMVMLWHCLTLQDLCYPCIHIHF